MILLPKNEIYRIQKLQSYNILDTPPESMFDDLTKMASHIMKMPIALISLVDSDRQWFKSKVGLDVDQTTRDISFCQHTILDSKIFEVEDASKDERFSENPLVTGYPEIRFYAGVPLEDNEGYNLGTLCVIDREPRRLDNEQRDMLRTLGRTVFRQIEFRKTAMEQEVFSKFFEMTLNMLCVAGLDGYFKLINPAFSQILGYTMQGLKTIPFMDLVHPDDRKKTERIVERLAAGEKIKGFENRFRAKDGNYVQLNWNCNSDPSTGQLFAVAYDLTKSKKIQRELKDALTIKDQFMSNMSHEIRTPLSAIIGFTDILSQTQLDLRQTGYLDIISTASQNLSVIVNDILDFSKMEKGVALEKYPVSLKQVIQEVSKLEALKIKSKGLKLIQSIDSEIPDFVLTDKVRVTQIIVNLLNNAIKFTDKGIIEIQMIEQCRSENHTKVLFSIKDSGIGIAKDKLEHIFERFTQASKSTTRLYGGTGLGLNIVKMLVDTFEGKIWVESEPGKGTTFSFEIDFPISESPELVKEQGSTASNLSMLRGLKVLVAEDNEHNQILCTEYLERHRVQLMIVGNGQKCTEEVQKSSFDLILMDLQMPIMNGIEATHYIRNELNLDIPIVACSAHSLVGEREMCLSSGMDEYISKPYTETNLVNTLTKVLSERKRDHEEHDSHDDRTKIMQALKSLELETSEKVVTKMTDIYVRRIPDDISELQVYMAQKNFKELKSKGHFLSSTLFSMRLEEGYQMARDLEHSVDKGNEDYALKLTDKLIHYLRITLQTLKEINLAVPLA